jgi:hypothetical protein
MAVSIKTTVAVALLALLDLQPAHALDGRIVDATSGAGIADATVTVDGEAVTTSAAGNFHIDKSGERVLARAPGYRANASATADFLKDGTVLQLTPFRPKALYLSAYTMAYAPKRDAALKLIAEGGLNAVVVDLKNDQGLVVYPTAVPTAAQIGARRVTTIRDLAVAVNRFHEQHLYAIARIVVFKDNLLATAHPDWAVHRDDGSIYRDNEGMAWIEAFHQEARDYVIALATEAARAGFDEVQFDYVRFPDSRHLKFSQESTEETRVDAITTLLKQARKALTPYNTYLSADIFGYVCWNTDDTHIGQHLENLVAAVDYVSPMLYPSGFQFGIRGYPDPVAQPYEIVNRSLEHAKQRVKLPGVRFRPWLQDFRDYAFDRRDFGPAEVSAQIRAAEDADSDGWMIWNPRNVYSQISQIQTALK